MALSDAELKVLRLFVNQGHNDAIWALTMVGMPEGRRKHTVIVDGLACPEFNPMGDAEHAKTLIAIDQEFEDSLFWLADGRKPWA